MAKRTTPTPTPTPTPPAKVEKSWAKLLAPRLGIDIKTYIDIPEGKTAHLPTAEWWSRFLLAVVDFYGNQIPLEILDMRIGCVVDSWGTLDNLVAWLYEQPLPRHKRDFRSYLDDITYA